MADPAEDLIQRLIAMSRLTGDYKSMLKAIEDQERRTPEEHTVYVLKGWVQTQLKEYDKASESFDKALKLNPKSAWAYFRKGQLLEEREDHIEALICFVKAVKLKPARADFWIEKAAAEAQLEKFPQALKSFEKAIKLGDKTGVSWYGKARILHLQGNVKEAAKACDNAMAQNPAEGEYRNLKATLAKELDKA